ncbi:MAG: hypothetical protein PVF66_01010, partial [Candidatus Aminicenantes bacterium]
QDEKSEVRRVEHVVKEVENTVNFVEDRENRKIRSFCIRQGFFEEEKILSHLQERSSLPVNGIESCLTDKIGLREKKILSPLIGQIR